MENNELAAEIKELKETIRDLSALIASRLPSFEDDKKDRSSKLSVRQAAKETGVSIQTVHNWIKQRKITAIDYGGKIVIDKKKLNEFLEKSKVESISDITQRSVNGGGRGRKSL